MDATISPTVIGQNKIRFKNGFMYESSSNKRNNEVYEKRGEIKRYSRRKEGKVEEREGRGWPSL